MFKQWTNGSEVNSMKNLNNIVILVGADGIKAAYEKTLQSKKIDIVCLSTNYEQVIGSFFEREYSPRLYDAVRATREILPDTQGNRSDAKSKEAGHELKFIKTSQKSESDMILTEDSLTLISFDPTGPCAVVICDSQIVESMKMQFEALWKGLEG